MNFLVESIQQTITEDGFSCSVDNLGSECVGEKECDNETKCGNSFHLDEWSTSDRIMADRDGLQWLVVAFAGSSPASSCQLLIGLVVVDFNLNPSRFGFLYILNETDLFEVLLQVRRGDSQVFAIIAFCVQLWLWSALAASQPEGCCNGHLRYDQSVSGCV